MAGTHVECSFLIPLCRDANLSDGLRHGRKVWKWLELQLFIKFGGFTRAPGAHVGVYEDPDTRNQVRDESRKYIVAVAEWQLGELRSVLSAACVFFQQKCIYLSIAGRVEFVELPPNEPNQSIS